MSAIKSRKMLPGLGIGGKQQADIGWASVFYDRVTTASSVATFPGMRMPFFFEERAKVGPQRLASSTWADRLVHNVDLERLGSGPCPRSRPVFNIVPAVTRPSPSLASLASHGRSRLAGYLAAASSIGVSGDAVRRHLRSTTPYGWPAGAASRASMSITTPLHSTKDFVHHQPEYWPTSASTFLAKTGWLAGEVIRTACAPGLTGSLAVLDPGLLAALCVRWEPQRPSPVMQLRCSATTPVSVPRADDKAAHHGFSGRCHMPRAPPSPSSDLTFQVVTPLNRDPRLIEMRRKQSFPNLCQSGQRPGRQSIIDT